MIGARRFGLGRAAFAVTVLLPALALAQTTDCTQDPITGRVTCKTRAAAEPDSDCSGGKLSALAAGCSLGAIERARANEKNRKTVGQLIADGKCGDARLYALRSGDLDLAERVTRLCAAD